MLYLFDLDGTLISGYMDRPDRDFTKWGVLPGRVEYLVQLRAHEHQLGIVTNQAGVAFGHVTKADVGMKLIAVLVLLDLPLSTPCAVCFSRLRRAWCTWARGQRMRRRRATPA
jgi:D-glycero-D-manno-heptose 1,7-bisphosphate phosphatase